MDSQLSEQKTDAKKLLTSIDLRRSTYPRFNYPFENPYNTVKWEFIIDFYNFITDVYVLIGRVFQVLATTDGNWQKVQKKDIFIIIIITLS